MTNLYQTTLLRSATAFLAGSILGATLFTIPFIVYIMSLYINETPFIPERTASEQLESMLALGAEIYLVALIGWVGGLGVVALPAWLIAHHLSFRGPASALAIGLALSFLCAIGWTSSGFGLSLASNDTESDAYGALVEAGELTIYGWQRAAMLALPFTVVGCIVAMTVWRIAYRRQR